MAGDIGDGTQGGLTPWFAGLVIKQSQLIVHAPIISTISNRNGMSGAAPQRYRAV